MTTATILAETKRRGIKLRTDGSIIYCRPRKALGPKILEAIRERKPELIEHLRRHESGRVGPWQPPGAITRACTSCGGGLQPGDPHDIPCSTCQWTEHMWPQRPQ